MAGQGFSHGPVLAERHAQQVEFFDLEAALFVEEVFVEVLGLPWASMEVTRAGGERFRLYDVLGNLTHEAPPVSGTATAHEYDAVSQLT